MRANGIPCLSEGHAEYDDKEVDGVACALGVRIGSLQKQPLPGEPEIYPAIPTGYGDIDLVLIRGDQPDEGRVCTGNEIAPWASDPR